MLMLKLYMTNLNQFVWCGYDKLAQLFIDGPNGNWKVFRLVEEHVKKQTGKKLLNVGSCGLHVTVFCSGVGCLNFSYKC